MSQKTLRILCFGDSLTAGWCQRGMLEHPYSLKLEEKLRAAFPHANFAITTNGLPGDIVTFERFERRLKKQYPGIVGVDIVKLIMMLDATALDVRDTYDWAIILGGTNDLAYNIPGADIYQSLQNLWNISTSKGSKVLALTIPETRPRPDHVVQRRDEVNLKILTHQAPNYYFYDLESHIPYHSLSEDDRDKYWEDGLHLTSAGYDWMGEHIADGLIRILKREKQLDPPKPSRKPLPSQPREGLSFDEEAGNPRNISEGYIVVRKHDLD